MLLFCAAPQRAFAAVNEEQPINYIKDIFNEEKGLPTGEANAVVQSSEGYLWFGSYSGLIRFDGSTMVNFSDHLANAAIRSLYEGSDGTLYIGTNGASAYAFLNDTFTHIQAENEREFLNIRDFAEAQDGTIYVASLSGAAKIKDGRLQGFFYSELDGVQLIGIAVDSFGNIWALSDEANIYVFNEENFLALYPSTELFTGYKFSSICNDNEGNLYIGSTGNQILTLKASKPAANPLDGFTRSSTSTGDTVTINSLDPARDGSILVSAMNGFGFLDRNGIYHKVDQDSSNNLSANCAALDIEGNLWVASSNYGIVRYSVGCFDSCNYNSNLGEYSINGIAKQGDLFYLVNDDGLMLFDENWRQVENALTEAMHGIRIRNVTVDTKDRVWLATYSYHGALCYDPATGETTDYGLAQGVNSEKIRVVYALSDGRMLVGNQGGVNIIENGKVVESYGRSDGMETSSVLCAMELDGRIYVGTDGSGIYEITDRGLVNLSFDQGLTEGVILRMQPDADGNGNFYVCASDKLFYCENGAFRVLNNVARDSGSIFSVYDVDGMLWILQNGGINAVNKADVLADKDVYTAYYGIKCGLTGSLSANTWNWLDDDGSLYMPTRSGVSLFHFHGPAVPVPHAILNSILVDETLYEHPTSVTIPRNAQRITIDISQLLFSDTAEFNMGYYLEGFDNKVSFTTDKHVSISYTNLRGGDYTLKVRVIDPVTGQSTAQQTIPIVKEKRLVEYTWFYIACGLFGVFIIEEIIRFFFRRKTRAFIKRQEEQRHFINEITKVFSKCIDMRDHYTNGHSARVAKYTELLARKLGMNEEQVSRIYHIALLHDVGKISIPDAVLNKPSRLTNEEYEEMKSHAQRGYDVLKDMDFFPELALGAGCHHERWDGKGYPRGLKGEEIPEVAQIIAVADTFDAMYSTRPYRKKMELSTVVEEIRRGSGTQFSPRVVEAFLQLAKEGAFDNE